MRSFLYVCLKHNYLAMIKIINFSIFFFFSVLVSSAQNSKFVASCCDSNPKEEGRCTGSAYCSACSNCSRCAHCSNGGSCGVCASYVAPVRYKAPSSSSSSSRRASSKSTVKASSKTDFYTSPKKEPVSPKVKTSYRSEDMLAVNFDNLMLREGPGTEYDVLEVLQKYAILKVIAIDGEWLQVVVVESKKIGYVNAKYVYKI
jgi:hypothetical protein